MLFHSTEFLFVFLPVTWIGFLVLVKLGLTRATCGWLTLASLVFYAWWNPPYIALIAGSILVNFWVGRLACPHGSRLGARVRLAALLAGLAANLGALGYFKYANFFVENVNLLFGAGFDFDRVILPLAISFFTFQQVAYIVDAYRGGTHRYGFVEYAFFVSFFPQLIAGPIVHHNEVMPQIAKERWKPIRVENLQVGATIFAIGLFKKMVLADGCAEYATPLFDAAAGGEVLSAAMAWTAAVAYALQLYFDFSGYSDMATGLARMFGIVLPINFNAPYRATSIIDFWRRWHITLSRFLRDYVYIPLGGSRRGITLRYTNLLVTMLIGGLWHGAGWTFVAWGALHGGYLVANHLFRAWTGAFFESRPWARFAFAPFAWALTMVAVLVGWVFFRAEDFGAAAGILRSMFWFGGEPGALAATAAALFADGVHLWWLGLVGAIALLAPSTQQYLRDFVPALDMRGVARRRFVPVWRPNALHGVLVGCVVFVTVRRYFSLAPTEFLYFNF